MDSTNGITSVTSLFVDSRDRLWIGTNANGFAVMERGEYRIWDRHDGLRSDSIRAFAEDEAGNIYVATTAGVAIVDGDMNMSMIAAPEIESAYVGKIRSGVDGRIYGLTQFGDLFRLKNGALEKYLSHEICRVKDVVGILPDPLNPGALYLGTEGSKICHGSIMDNFETMETVDASPLSYIEDIECIDGQLWICSNKGIGKIDDDGFHLLDNLPMDNKVTNVMTDYEGNLWFTSERQGVMKVVPNRFSNIFEQCELPEAVVNSSCMLDSRLFVGTDTGLIVIEDGKSWTASP